MLDFGFYNMDCMEGMKQFPDNYFDLAIVDPVYGGVTQGGYMQGKGGEHAAKRRDYHLGLWSQEKTGSDYFKELQRVSKNQIIWGGNYFCSNLPESQGWIVWDKKHPEGVTFADCELAWTSFDVATRIFRFMWNGMLQEDMKNKEYKIHPTQKPVRLYEWLLQNYAKDGDVILDTHVGSASSLIACHNTRHKYVGFEIDKTYYDKAKARLDAEMAQATIFDFMKE
jgi:site-specific DNA-methyltransferase (adenine-specific)